MSTLREFVELRGRLLRAELAAALLVGRTQDAGAIRAEMRFLEVQPQDAMMVRVGHGRAVSGSSLSAQANFENQSNVAKRRLVELEAEVAAWQAARATRHMR